VNRSRLNKLVAISAIVVSWGLPVEGQVQATDDKVRLAGVLLDKGSYAEAIVLYGAWLEGGASIEKKDRARALNNIGFAHYKLKNLTAAREYYGRALSLDPEYVTCLNNMAAVLMNEKRYADALTYLQRAYASEKTVKVVFNLFAVHYYLGHREDALSFVEEALRLDEKYTEARLRAKKIKQTDIEKLKRRMR
jgi:tetratricopeptide (TPR) repeat protein